MNATDIDIGHDKGLDVLYVANEPVEIVDKGQDKGQSVPYNTITVVSNESDMIKDKVNVLEIQVNLMLLDII
ncbi:MAG: hypothetical protein IPN55_15690 [Saprospiraceae bacterium]|nr:hypothetical protein [Candidatus Brachybacter algidus]